MCVWSIGYNIKILSGTINVWGILAMRKNKIRIMHVAQAAGGVDRYIRMLLKYLGFFTKA